MINETLNFTVQRGITDCGALVANVNTQISFNTKLVSIVLIFLIIFEWWALNKVMHGDLTHERKKIFYGFIMTFIHSLILFGAFYLMYWLVLSGFEF